MSTALETQNPTDPQGPTRNHPAPPTAMQATWLVAQREIRVRLRTKSFLISTAIMLLLVIGGIVASSLIAANAEDTKVAVVGDPAGVSAVLDSADGIAPVAAGSRDAAEAMIEDGDVSAAIVADASSPTGFAILAETEAPTALVAGLSVSPTVELLDPSPTDSGLRYLVALGFGLVFFFAATMFGTGIAQSVVEEKQTRIIEILVAAISPRSMLAGKVVGTSILAFGQIALLIAATVIGLTVTGQGELLALLGAPVLWFGIFFVFGFILLAALFAAAGALVSRTEDISAAAAPITTIVMIPYFLVVFANDNPLVVGIMSYVPFSAPVGMPLRLFLGDAAWWEPILALVILAATTLAVVAFGARIYENSLLRMGARVSWRNALRR